MVSTAFVIHGTKGSPDGNWFPWIADELADRGIDTYRPAFPTPEGQHLEAWCDAFAEYEPLVDAESVFIAHSVGPAFLCHLLERPGTTARACFFVAGFTGLLGHEEFDRLNESITDREFDFERIRASCDLFRLYHAENDPYVPLAKAETLATALDGDLTVYGDGGHLNEPFGYTEFPDLLDDVLAVVEDDAPHPDD